jgi:hypothetical protein
MWENMVERDRLQMTIWRMRIACWLPKITHTLTCNTYIVLLSAHIEVFYCCQQLALFIARKVAHSAVNTTQHVQSATTQHNYTAYTVTRNKGRCYGNSMSICITSRQCIGLHTGHCSFMFIFVTQRCGPLSYVTYRSWRMTFLHTAAHKHDRNNFHCLQHFVTSGHTTWWSRPFFALFFHLRSETVAFFASH